MNPARRFPYSPPPEPAPSDERIFVTASVLLVRDGRVLLERRPDDAAVSPGLWDSPGGHVEAGETPEATLRREMREELGIRLRAPRLHVTLSERERASGRLYRHHVFVAAACEGEPAALEGQRIAWFTLDDALALPDLNPLTGHAIEKLPRD